MLHEVLTLAFDEQPTDHGGDHVTPMTSSGVPYRYALVGHLGRPATTYASTAEALLTVLIPGYEPFDGQALLEAPEASYHDAYIEHVMARTRYAYGVAFDHAAQALINDVVTAEELRWLQRSLDYDNPLTMDELPEWNCAIPMILLSAYYSRDNLAAPAGNILWLDAYTPELLIEGLARAGIINLREHTLDHAGPPTVTIRAGELPAHELLSNLQAQLDMTAANLGNPAAEDHHRESLQVLAARILQWTELPAYDLEGKMRTRIEEVIAGNLSVKAAKDLSKILGRLLDLITPSTPDPDE